MKRRYHEPFSDEKLTKIDDIPNDVFVKAWEHFAENEGLDIALHIKSYRDEISCESDHATLGSFIDNAFVENDLLVSWMSAADMLPCDSDAEVREMLQNSPEWREHRRKATEKFKKLGSNVIDDALKFVAKNRREGKACPRPVPIIDPKTDLDEQQRLVWTLSQMAVTDSLPPNDDGTDRQLLMHVSGDAGCGKSHIIHCLQNDPDFLKRARFLTPTGTAAVQLGNAQTAHSGLYLPIGECRAGPLDMDAMRSFELC